ncbi:putative transcription factor C2H2 family [Arabidopsis thaliana]
MATESINAATVNDSDRFIFSTPLSARGSTKRDAISVEDFDLYRRFHSSQTPFKSGFTNYIDLGQYNDEDDDICVERKPRIESFRINGCSHTYCNDCVSKYIAAKLQDNILSIKCPVSGCSGQLEPDKCRQILPREVFDRWGDSLCEAVIMSSKRFYCPYKDCSALLFLDESEEEKMNESECPHCHRMVCVECGTKWHPEITCEEFQKLAENERERGDILLKNMAESKKWRRCPPCKFYIEKSEGCLYMKCRCGLAFCYNCGTPSKDHTHYCYSCRH